MFQEYKETFRENNPGILLRMSGMFTEDYNICDDNNREMEDTSMENNDVLDNKETYFKHNYSNDYAPDWLKDARD